MTITNRQNLPEAIVKACSTEQHNRPNTVSATTLLKGAKEIILTRRHWDELTDDVADRIWALFGTAVHSMLEHETPDTFTEEYLTHMVNGYKVTGRIDCYDMKNGIVHDYKTASVWKVAMRDFDDWKKQGLIYAYLLKENGFNVSECRFTALLKDFSKTKAKFDANYPQSPVFVYSFNPTEKDMAYIEKFIRDKIAEIVYNESLPDDEIAECTKDERWATDDKFAVMKKGNKKASRVCDSLEQAESYVSANADKDKLEIVKREATSKKCLEYCQCAEFCNFYKSLKEESVD
jgi:hypothetical protein